MIKKEIPLDQTGFFSEQTLAYSKNDERLKPFYNYSLSIDSVEVAIENRNQFPFFRNEVVAVLKMQYEKIGATECFPSIEKLLQPNTFTVTTAHQPNLLLGPLYTIYKAISAINSAEMLTQKINGKNFVPVFWLGSEDHDLDELAHFNLNGRKWEWNPEQKGAFGRMKCNSLLPIMEELFSSIGNSIHAVPLKQIIQQCFTENASIAQATQKLLNVLLGKFGLIVLDADDQQLKKCFSNVMMEELLKTPSEKIVNETGVRLQENFKPQAQPRPINLFYLDENGRNRIEKTEKSFSIANTKTIFSEAEILEVLKSNPEKFSPNVILRPLYQEMILPNVVFIGGGAEVNYFSQLKNIFQHYKIHFPVCMLRNSATFIDTSTANKMEQVNISEVQIFSDTDVLIRDFISKQNINEYNLDSEKNIFQNLIVSIKQKAAIDKGLSQTAEAECVRITKSFEQLEEKFLRAAKKKEEVNIERIKQIKEKLFPQNQLQERFENWMKFYLIYGDEWIEMIKRNFTPFSFSFTILTDHQVT